MHIKNFDPYDFSKKDIDGVPVYYKNLPWSPCIHIWVSFQTGALEDPEGKEGLSHFLEHMIFDGSPKLPDKKTITTWSKIHAMNSWNAWTSWDNTVYTLKCLPESFGSVLEGMKDMIFNSNLRESDVEHERKVIVQEAWGRFSNHKYLKYAKELSKNLFKGHSHSRSSSPLGWPETVERITREDLAEWHKKKYGKGNFFIVITGAIEDSHLKMLNEFVQNLPVAEKKKKKIETINKPTTKKIIKSADDIGEVKEQVEISIMRISLPPKRSEDEVVSLFRRLAFDLFHERLRIDHSLCYSVSIDEYTGNSFFFIGLNVKTEVINIDLVIKEFWKIIHEIIDKKHLEKFYTIKKLGIGQVRSKERLSNDIGYLAVRDITRNKGKIVTLDERLLEMQKVTYKDLIKFAKETFDPAFTFTEIITPSKKVDPMVKTLII